MDGFMQLVKDMRAAQKDTLEYSSVLKMGTTAKEFEERYKAFCEALQRSKALEKRVDEEIAAAERQELANAPDCIRMANGQTLRQGNLFEDQ